MSFSNELTGADKLESDLLRTFLAIADAGSFTRGAERIYRSQSAVSLQVKRLETVLGQPVFERHGRGIALTVAGEKLRPMARRVVDLLDTAMGELRHDALEGTVRVGIPDEYGENVLPGVIARFARDHPRVELAVRCGFSVGFPDALARDELDLAVHAVETARPGSNVLGTEETVWAGSRLHAAHECDPLPVALFDRECWWRERAIEALESAGRRFRVVYTSESVTGIMAAITAGAGVGLLGRSFLRDDFRALTPVDGFPAVPASTLVLDCRNGNRSSAVDAMAGAITETFASRGHVA